MDEFKGTPGPWELVVSTTEIYIQAETFETARITAHSENGLSELEWNNANLISAAPKLLEVVMKAQEAYEKDGHLLNFNAGSLLPAINKALGKEVGNG